MAFARGFKTWCENTSKGLRKEIGLGPLDPICTQVLARHLGVLVWNAEDVPGVDSEALETLLVAEPDSWSALTVRAAGQIVVIMNSTHTGGRPASNLAHELAHLILDHTAARVDISEDGFLVLQSFDRQQENEADWLAGCLLLPRPALLATLKAKIPVSTIARQFGVSVEMVQYRVNVTGVEAQVRAGSRTMGR